ncbi:serum response factor-like isoform X2 [Cebidichthys violaceus]|uniref:serum response factor-like isoform X2 n=1 Tax=Cebidichthys violaceus TaxID=271503 RepID=UPI0035CC10EB
MGTRTGTELTTAGLVLNTDRDQFEDVTEVLYSGSDQDSDSGDDEDTCVDRRGVKRERSEREVGHQSTSSGHGGLSPGAPGAKPGKKTRGRVKIKMEFIDNKLRRYTTFSKRKTGIMKKAYELSTLTGTQVLLLVASETGHVYTFATRKLQPMITSETGKALIQTCLNSPDSPPRSDPTSDQRMSATGFEETDLTYQVTEAEGGPEAIKVQTGAPSWQPPPSTNGTVLKTSAGVMLPGGFTLMSGASLPPGTHTIPLSQLQGQPLSIQVQSSTNQSSSDIHSTASLPAPVMSSSSSSSSVAGHMMYPGGHTVMYATPTSSLSDGGLTVLNTFPPTSQSHDPGSLPQVFFTSLPPVTAQIPVSAVQLHPMVISQQSSSNLTELQLVSLDVHQSKDD